MKVGDGTPSLVIPRPVRKLVVGIRLFAVQSTAPPMAAGVTDWHAAFAARNDHSFGRTLPIIQITGQLCLQHNLAPLPKG